MVCLYNGIDKCAHINLTLRGFRAFYVPDIQGLIPNHQWVFEQLFLVVI